MLRLRHPVPLVLVLLLAACGGEAPRAPEAVGAGDGAAVAADAPERTVEPVPGRAPARGDAPPPAQAAGAATPHAALAALRAVAEAGDAAGYLGLVPPAQRGLVAFLFGYAGPALVTEVVGTATAVPGGEEPPRGPRPLADLAARFAALREKHGVDLGPDGAIAKLQLLRTDPEALAVEMQQAFAGVDHEAFVRESMALLEEQGDVMGPVGSMFRTTLPSEVESMAVEDGRAVVRTAGHARPIEFLQHDGRWYLDFLSTLRSR